MTTQLEPTVRLISYKRHRFAADVIRQSGGKLASVRVEASNRFFCWSRQLRIRDHLLYSMGSLSNLTIEEQKWSRSARFLSCSLVGGGFDEAAFSLWVSAV